jgi:TRAP transporter TAXI family solute receptor
MFRIGKKIGAGIAAVGAAALISLAIGSVNAAELRLGTASQGGAFYPVGQTISTLVTKHAGDDISMVPIVTEGSVQNPRLIGSGEVDAGITNNNLAVLANKNIGPYKDAGLELRAIGSLHPSILHMMVLADSEINSIADLKGKRVAAGPAGGGTIPFLNAILGLEGLTIDDVTPNFVSYEDGFSQLSDGIVDASFALSGYPAGAVMQAKASAKLKFINLSAEQIAALKEKTPAYDPFTIETDVYDTAEAGSVIGVSNMLVVNTTMDEDLAYKITKAIYGNMDEFRSENALAKQIDPAKSLSLSIPLHPGAERFFKE